MKNKKKTVLSVVVFLITLSIIFVAVFIKFSNKSESLATNAENVEEKTYEKANIEEFNINEIINNNTAEPIREEIVSEEVDLEYTTIYQNSNTISKGKVQVSQEGRDGKQSVITKKKYQGNELVGEEQTGRTIKVAAVDKIVQIGTGENATNHKIQKGDNVSVTSATLNVFLEKDKNSNKITTLQKDDQVNVIEVDNEWCKIRYNSYLGWVDINCLEYKQEKETKIEQNSNKVIVIENSNTKTKEQLSCNLNENMSLNVPSGLTLEQFKKVLSNNDQDKNKIFEQNAEYFYYIEKQYNINGLFVAAVGIHESAWGTSKISADKKNLFGYGASDSNPYNNAYTFSSYSEGIDLLARVFVKYYINPAGKKIYDNEIATGKYYSGPTLAEVNKKYASDKNWNKSVYNWMKYLYNKL